MQPSRPQVMTTSDHQAHEPDWVSWSNEQLLTLPMSQLGVTLEGAFLSAQIQQLYAELAARQLLFRPHVWLSNEWFTPDGVPGIADRKSTRLNSSHSASSYAGFCLKK